MNITDHVGVHLKLEKAPERIISLCPSQTELLIDLGLGDRIVARTRYCIHPENIVQGIETVGGTKKIDMKKVADLNPDLVIGEKEENTVDMIQELRESYPVFVTDVTDLASALKMIRDLGAITYRQDHAIALAMEIESELNSIKDRASGKSIVYLIWNKPIMAAGKNTYIAALLDWMGFENPVLMRKGRYPELSLEVIKNWQVDALLLSSEPFPFEEKHKVEFQQALPNVKIEIVDGEMFSWYGSRMKAAIAYLDSFLLQYSA